MMFIRRERTALDDSEFRYESTSKPRRSSRKLQPSVAAARTMGLQPGTKLRLTQQAHIPVDHHWPEHRRKHTSRRQKAAERKLRLRACLSPRHQRNAVD